MRSVVAVNEHKCTSLMSIRAQLCIEVSPRACGVSLTWMLTGELPGGQEPIIARAVLLTLLESVNNCLAMERNMSTSANVTSPDKGGEVETSHCLPDGSITSVSIGSTGLRRVVHVRVGEATGTLVCGMPSEWRVSLTNSPEAPPTNCTQCGVPSANERSNRVRQPAISC